NDRLAREILLREHAADRGEAAPLRDRLPLEAGEGEQVIFSLVIGDGATQRQARDGAGPVAIELDTARVRLAGIGRQVADARGRGNLKSADIIVEQGQVEAQ